MTYWDGNLSNTAGDIVLDILLLGVLFTAYLPQVHRIVTRSSIQGISPYFLLFNAIFSNAQFSEALLFHALAYPNDRQPVLKLIGERNLTGWAAFGGVAGMLQIALQWACSTVLIVMYSSINGGKNGGVAAVALVHSAVCLLPAACLSLPAPKPRDMSSGILIGFLNMTNTLVAPFFAILQFFPQYLELRRSNQGSGALSVLSLGLQVLVLTAVTLRWFLRLGTPTWGRRRAQPWMWYVWGMLPFNYAFYIIGCAILLAGYTFRARATSQENMADERLPLLI